MLGNDGRAEAVKRMQRYIEEHLTEPITLADLANCAFYSPWHAARMFKEHTGKAPFEYIRLRRLSAAARKLGETSAKIVDVAFDFEFDSHEGFTRAFSRHFGMTPRQFRKAKEPVVMFMPEQMHHYYARKSEGGTVSEEKSTQTVFVQVMERPERKLILKRGQKATHYFEYCEEVGCDVWKELADVKEALHEPMGMWLPEKIRLPGTSEYVQGVEVDLAYDGPIPEGFETMDLPACMMMVFQGQPFEDDDYGEAISSLVKVIEGYRPETFGFAWDDDAGPRFQLEPSGYRGYIEGRPVKRVSE